MLAEPRDAPFTKTGWLFELKYDGYRLLAERDGRRGAAAPRNGDDATATFPEIARALRALPFYALVLDGEVVVLDDEGRPSFQRLQKRALLQRRPGHRARRGRAARDALRLRPARLRGLRPARPLPLASARRCSSGSCRGLGRCATPSTSSAQGEALLEQVERSASRASSAKKADSPYRGGRSATGSRCARTAPATSWSSGFTRPEGARAGFGALHLGGYRGRRARLRRPRRHRLHGQAARARSASASRPPRARRPPARAPCPTGKGHVWVEPELVVRGPLQGVDGRRAAAAAGLPALPRRQAARRVRVPKTARRSRAARPSRRPKPRRAASEKTVPLHQPRQGLLARRGLHQGRPDRVLPRHRAVAAALPQGPPAGADALPRRHRREVVLPEGRARLRADWLRIERIWSEHAEREIDYFVCDDLESLLYVANLGTIPLHVWASRVASLERPDWCILDLDPKGAPFSHVVKVALRDPRALRGDRAARLHQDERRDGAARAGAARRPVHVRAVADARRAAGARRSRRSCPTSRPSRARSPRAAAGSTSTTCRTATARRSPRPSPRGRSSPASCSAPLSLERGQREARSEELHDEEPARADEEAEEGSAARRC